MVKEIVEMEGIVHDRHTLGGGLAYTISSKISKKKVKDHLRYIDSACCKVHEVVPWRVDPGGDLFNSLKAKIYKEKLYPAVIPAMVGTLTKASLRYFLSDKSVFHINTIMTPTGLKLVSGSGTVALEEDRVQPRIHVVVADHTGSTFGGHLFPGTEIKEYVEGFLIKLKGVRFERIWSDRIRAFPLHFIKAR